MLTVADTAFTIAAVRAAEAELPTEERLFEDPYASIFAGAGAHAAEGTARYLSLPFFRDGIRLRTRFLDDAVRDGLAAGLDQVVLLGAGFDARGLRMSEIAARPAKVWEIDLEAQLARKRALLAAAHVELPSHLVHVGAAFEAPDWDVALERSLQARGFRVGVGAVFVWEGVIGYVDAAAIERSLAFMARVGGRGSRLAFTFGPSTFDPEGAAERLRRTGWSSVDELGADDVWRRYLPGDPHPNAWASRLGVAAV